LLFAFIALSRIEQDANLVAFIYRPEYYDIEIKVTWSRIK